MAIVATSNAISVRLLPEGGKVTSRNNRTAKPTRYPGNLTAIPSPVGRCCSPA